MTKEEFLALPVEEQRTVLAEMKRQALARVREIVGEDLDADLAAQLVPRLSFKAATPSRVEISPPSGDPDEAARAFFRQFPATKSIRIGDTLYERG